MHRRPSDDYPVGAAGQGRPVRERLATMVAISLAVGMASLDSAIANTVLPSLSAQLGVGPAAVIWVVTSYQLVMVAAMLPLAALGEAVGHRKVFTAGVVVFTVTSFLCGMADSLSSLVAARAAQGMGAAAIMGSNTALVRLAYPPERLGRGLGLNALVIALGLAGGPVVASGVLAFTSWHWLFYLNVPLGACAGLLAWRMKAPQSDEGRRFDLVAALLCSAAFALSVHGLGALAHGGMNVVIAAEWALALCCGAWLVRREHGCAAPILPVDLFRNAPFALSSATAVCAFTTQGLALVALPFLFHTVLGRSQTEIGMLIAPWPITGAVMAPFAGSLSDRVPPGLLGGLGLCCLAASIASLTLLDADASAGVIMLCTLFCGFGFGLFLSPNQRMLMSSAPAGRSGSASGVLGVTRLLGQTTGAALVALGLSASLRAGVGPVLWTGVGFAACGAVLSLLRLLVPQGRVR
ncbi:MFS transporter [Chitinasiproducens palmae]|uniref:MFS transporter, DHA2 family, multidrug resistance protein n=1 Tax=Chitinasiproducens palmae TaxID=1770053 RepID=A0A1H2PLK9_9BURK|nr:MFS transporter [Chitinasiproducens palmae]SDV47326.1 MFS transporter, DHA2 family, multidrug resistance protein [Chitinasiproducens palmae]